MTKLEEKFKPFVKCQHEHAYKGCLLWGNSMVVLNKVKHESLMLSVLDILELFA